MDNLEKLFEESIKMELNVYEIYMFFKNIFPEDEKFWWKIALEEQEHAAILKSGRDYFDPVGQFPENLLTQSVTELAKDNQFCQETLGKFEEKHPTREEAFNLALSLEGSVAEIHYQNFMHKESNNELHKIFQQLNGDDIDHYTRIKSYMLENGINIINPE